MPSDASPPTCLRIDEDRFDQVIGRVTEVLGEVDSHKARVFDRSFWNWQYRDTPAGRTRVYGIMAGDVLMGYYHVPVYEARINGRAGLLAMVQEVAVSSDLRGQGMFRRLAEFATEDLLASGIEAAYTFPNRKSIHTFLKYNGYRRVTTLPAYILPVRSGSLIGSRLDLRGLERGIGRLVDQCWRKIRVPADAGSAVQRHDKLTGPLLECFAAYQQRQTVALVRDARYLVWRFEKRPASRHFFFSLQRRGKMQAAAIFKLDEMLGQPALLLMDFAYLAGEQKTLLQLIQAIATSGEAFIGQPFDLIFTCTGSRIGPWLKKIGFFRVPTRLNPRPLDLVVRHLAGSAPAVFDPAAWHVTLTDWDVM